MSKRSVTARQARRGLDAKLASVNVAALAVPRHGWIRTVREALFMTSGDLGRRMGPISRQAVSALEARERAGTITIERLRAAADALGCHLVVAFIPRTSLESTVQTEAARIADALIADTIQTMSLEGQSAGGVLPASRQDLIDDIIRDGKLWT